jgi:hypothetical protein
MFDPFPKNRRPIGAATPVQREARNSPEFAPGRLCRKVNNTKGNTGKAKPVASAAFLGVFALLDWKESECCKTGTDLAG